jgi:maltose O-acetyltransferase
LYGARYVWVGDGVVIMEHAEIRAHPSAASSRRDPVVHLGDGSRLARFMTIWATVGVHFGERVSTSDNVAVVDCWYPPDMPTSGVPVPDGAPVTIEDGAYLGYGCVVGPGVTVGSGAFVGEGAVVLDDVPPHSVVYGNPARVTKRWTVRDGWQGRMFGETA